MIDLTEENLYTIANTHIHNMRVSEAVSADRRLEAKFHYATGIWWREVKPFFYQPAAFMTRIVPRSHTPTWYLAAGGYYHLVPDGAESNGGVTVNEISSPASFELEHLKRGVRYRIRSVLKKLSLARIESLDILVRDGYRIYLQWEDKYKDARVKRSNPDVFQAWSASLLAHPYKLIMGAFDGERLVAFIIAEAVEGVGQLSKTFTDSEYYSLSPASALNYAYLRICGSNSEILKACNGLQTGNATLEEYKVSLGYRAVTYPAYISLSAVVRPLVRWFLPTQYKRLMGQASTDDRKTYVCDKEAPADQSAATLHDAQAQRTT